MRIAASCVHRRGGVDASRSDARYQELVVRQLYTLRQRAVGPPLSAYSGWETPPLNKLSWVVTPTLYLLHAVVSALCCSVPRVLAASLLALL